MATQVPIQSAPAASAGTASLCGYCLQKPKFGTHDYCSKTCANQAAALCKYCHKKPKFQGFDYCGKTCSSTANPGKLGQAARNPTSNPPHAQAQGSTTQAHATTGAQSKGNSRGNNPNRSQPTTNATSGINAAQIAQIVAQQLPQLVAAANLGQAATTAQGTNGTAAQTSNASNGTSNDPFLNMLGQSVQAGLGAATAQPVAGQQNSLVAVATGTPPVIPSQSQTSAQSTNDNTSSPAAAPPAPGTTGTGNGASTQPSPGNTKCLIPGCNQPVYVDGTGVKVSNYCSKRHREEAVTSGLVAPCIMCLALPQGSNDYFCSRACREDANHKDASQPISQPVKST